MEGQSRCPECGENDWDYDDARNESACTNCGFILEGVNIVESNEKSSFDEDEYDVKDDLVRIRLEEEERRERLASARNPRLIPAPKKGSSSTMRVLDRIRDSKVRKSKSSGGKDWTGTEVIGFGQPYNDDGGWIGGEHEVESGATGEVLKAAESEANREAASFLGLGGKEEGKTDAILAAEMVCPPFERPEGPLRNPGLIRKGMTGERVRIDQVISSIVMSKFSGTVGRSRPMRKAEDGWGSNYNDWVLWEIYAQLTVRMGRPWFLGRWARTVGLNTRKLHSIMPCSRECVENMRLESTDSRLGPQAMSDLLDVFEGVRIDESVPSIAERILEDIGGELGAIGGLTLNIDRSPVRFHHGILILSNRNEEGTFDGSEYWDESEPKEFPMWHIPIALSLLQAMYEERIHHHPDGAYQRLHRFLVDEVERFTEATWDSLKSSWDELLRRSTGKTPFE